MDEDITPVPHDLARLEALDVDDPLIGHGVPGGRCDGVGCADEATQGVLCAELVKVSPDLARARVDLGEV